MRTLQTSSATVGSVMAAGDAYLNVPAIAGAGHNLMQLLVISRVNCSAGTLAGANHILAQQDANTRPLTHKRKSLVPPCRVATCTFTFKPWLPGTTE